MYYVQIKDTGEVFHGRDGENLLKVLGQSGKGTVTSGCRSGGCGICKLRIISGRYRCGNMSVAHVTDEDRHTGLVLACRVFIESDLVVETVSTACFRMACRSSPDRQP